MTLEELIHVLGKLNPNQPIPKLFNPHSYRGYYDHMAFEVDHFQKVTAFDLLGQCVALLDTEMYGYKGGEYKITKTTPVWVAEHGNTGQCLENIDSNGNLILGSYD